MKGSKKDKRKYFSRGRRADSQSLQALCDLLGTQLLQRDLLIEYLHQIQDKFNCLSADHLTALADLLKISVVEVYEVASFYHHFDVIDDNETAPPPLTVRVCNSIICHMKGADDLIQSLANDGNSQVRIQPVPCVGRCDNAPIAVVGKNPVDLANLEIIRTVISSKTFAAPVTNSVGNSGYAFLTQLHKDFDDKKREFIISQLEISNLRGFGGAGFPVGQKWRIVYAQTAPRAMAVNIDEGEPGTFKDLHYLEKDPQHFIEGMLIAALTVGIDVIYIYLRDEYPACHAMLQAELNSLRATPPYPLSEIHLRRGAGASGGILPASMADIPLDFDTLNEHGCFIGSAAVIVFSDADTARQIALNAMQFFAHESCGQCTPCRVGTAKAVKLMQQKVWDKELLQDLSTVMRDASICGLGQAAPNPMDCVIRYFPQEIGGSEK